MNKSDQVGELAKALSSAQSNFKGAKKDSQNPFFKSKYADLESTWDAIKNALSSNGLAVVQTTDSEENGDICLITTLMHSSGQWIEGRLPIRPLKNEPQAIGSAISYARRYALQAITGVCTVDDDGEAAQARTYQKPVVKEAQTPTIQVMQDMGDFKDDARDDPKASMKLLGMISKEMVRTKKDRDFLKDYTLQKYKIAKSTELTEKQANEVFHMLTQLPS